MVMLKQKDRLYYEDNKGVFIILGLKLNIFKEKVHIIGTDLKDSLYLFRRNKNKVYKVEQIL